MPDAAQAGGVKFRRTAAGDVVLTVPDDDYEESEHVISGMEWARIVLGLAVMGQTPAWMDFESYPEGFEVKRRGRTLAVTLLYPPRDDAEQPEKPRFVEFDQESVRASDGIRIHYDYERDGYVIEQSSRFAWGAEGPCDPDWQEVAFVQSWGRAETDEEETARVIRESDAHDART